MKIIFWWIDEIINIKLNMKIRIKNELRYEIEEREKNI